MDKWSCRSRLLAIAMQVHHPSILNKCRLSRISLSLVLRVPRRHMEMSFLFYTTRTSERLKIPLHRLLSRNGFRCRNCRRLAWRQLQFFYTHWWSKCPFGSVGFTEMSNNLLPSLAHYQYMTNIC